MDALNRHQRNLLRARGAFAERNENQQQPFRLFDVDFFNVPETNCTGQDWGENIDGWDIVDHTLDKAECSAHYENFKCLCRAYFSSGAIMGSPHYVCEHCGQD